MKKNNKKLISLLMLFVLCGVMFFNVSHVSAAATHVKDETIMVYDNGQYAGQISVHMEYHYSGSKVIFDYWYAVHAPNSKSYFIQDVGCNPISGTPGQCVVFYKLYSHNANTGELTFIKNPTYIITIY